MFSTVFCSMLRFFQSIANRLNASVTLSPLIIPSVFSFMKSEYGVGPLNPCGNLVDFVCVENTLEVVVNALALKKENYSKMKARILLFILLAKEVFIPK